MPMIEETFGVVYVFRRVVGDMVCEACFAVTHYERKEARAVVAWRLREVRRELRAEVARVRMFPVKH